MDRRWRQALVVAEQAAAWVLRLPTATPQEQAGFMVWLCKSPMHVRELLLAMRTERRLHQVAPKLTVDLKSLIPKEQSAVLQFSLKSSKKESCR